VRALRSQRHLHPGVLLFDLSDELRSAVGRLLSRFVEDFNNILAAPIRHVNRFYPPPALCRDEDVRRFRRAELGDDAFGEVKGT
jgi:hypothetical protein